MTQCSRCLGVDARDLDFGEMLTMSLLTLVVLAAAELDDADLVGAAMLAHGGAHGGAGHDRGADGDGFTGADQQHLVELHAGAFFGVQQLHAQDVALLYAVLLATGLDDCITHGNSPSVVILLGSPPPIRAQRTEDYSDGASGWSTSDQPPNQGCWPDPPPGAAGPELSDPAPGQRPWASSLPSFWSAENMSEVRWRPQAWPLWAASAMVAGICMTSFWPSGER